MVALGAAIEQHVWFRLPVLRVEGDVLHIGAAVWKLGTWDVIPIGIIAGLMASVEAAKALETPQALLTKPAAQGGGGAGGQPLRDNAHGPV